jgi:hypothetical protein
MMLGIGAIGSTLIVAICITPFRAWCGGLISDAAPRQ